MESTTASLVKLNDPPVEHYALVPRPAPDFIPGECAVTGEIKLFAEVAPDAKIEETYDWSVLMNGWTKSD